ncbi:hypothetical protein Cgig2_033552 [Carnegiea gigantea]|uniref:Uncharacterized protein n=1 Tax=Carnegiea gigantea TaxID=171969 RepID=A0A9Q1JTU2_9CARY|nr:hypothetical protein Cgig2_033552 [Carnegiea gigantea]
MAYTVSKQHQSFNGKKDFKKDENDHFRDHYKIKGYTIDRHKFDNFLITYVCQEVNKMLKEKSTLDSSAIHLNMMTSSGNRSSSTNVITSVFSTVQLSSDLWIGHKSHDNISVLHRPIMISLPDGSVKSVTLGGNVQLTSNIILHVLFVPYFKHNLCSKLLEITSLVAYFTTTGCEFQDPTTRKCSAEGKQHNGLYKLHAYALKLPDLMLELCYTKEVYS